MSDVPLGAMLSGGLDSSLIVALMARNMTEPVKTFSVGFVEDGASSELGDARSSRELFGTEHHELELSLHETQSISLEDLVWALDEPLADLSALGFMALSRARRAARDRRARRPGRRRAVRRLLEAPACRARRSAGGASARRSRCARRAARSRAAAALRTRGAAHARSRRTRSSGCSR